MGISRLIDYLERLRGRAPLPELLGRLQCCDIQLDDVQSFVRFANRTYRRNLVRSGPCYNLWVMCWRNGQRSHIHDHRGSSCGMRVLQGTLTETLFSFAPNGHIFPTYLLARIPTGTGFGKPGCRRPPGLQPSG